MIRRAVGSGLFALVICVIMCACEQKSGPAGSVSPSSTASRFTSEMDAKKAATALYQRYLAASDAISRDGGDNASRIAQFVTAAELKRELDGAAYLVAHALTVNGSSKLAKLQIQHADLKNGSVSAYTCVDFSGTRVLNRDGKDVTPPTRLDRQTTVSKFVWRNGGLVVDDVSAWSGKSIC